MVHNETSMRFVEGVASKPLITIFGQISNSLCNLCNLCLEYSVIALSCPLPAVAKSDVKITKDHSTEIDHASSLKRCAQKWWTCRPCWTRSGHHDGWILRQPTSLSLGFIVLHAMQRCFWWCYEDFDLGSCNMLLSFLVLSTLLFWVSIQWTEKVKVTLILTAGDKDDDYIKVVHVMMIARKKIGAVDHHFSHGGQWRHQGTRLRCDHQKWRKKKIFFYFWHQGTRLRCDHGCPASWILCM